MKNAFIDFPYFKKIRFVNDKKEGLAKSQMYTGELVINLYYWRRLKKEHQIYVLAHEEGHILFDTRNELEADAWASKRYLEAGFSITESIKALSEHLDRNNPNHILRAWEQYKRAVQFDKIKKKQNELFR